MRIPLSWLREYVSVPEKDTAQDVMAALVSVGLEEEGAVRPDVSGPVIVGQVLSCEPEAQNNGKIINWCQVDVGEAEPRGIVCGAHNFTVGDKIAACLPGAVLPGNFEISPRKTYGHISDGMMASSRELGLGEEHEGILRFADLNLNPEIGADALQILGLDDEAADINVTPDRSYCLSIRGVAREYSHAAAHGEAPPRDSGFTDPATVYRGREISAPAATADGYRVLIHDNNPIHGKAGADRFVARIVRRVDATAPTPRWMRERLRLAGIRPHSIIVDVTNYIMMELGQPLHAYDMDTLEGNIVVRRAADGERLITLDGSERSLHAEDLVIADDTGAIGLAGVMGGQSTAVDDSTRDVLIEAARFDEVSISRSSRRHKLPSEAAKRFSRGVDPKLAGFAAEKAALLLRDLAQGCIEAAVTDIDDVPESNVIVLPRDYVSQRVGIDYGAADIENALEAVGCRVARNGKAGYLVTAPSWRMDLVDAAGLSEEVARLIGYHKIPARLPCGVSGRGYTQKQAKRRRVVNALAASGLVEVSAYPFVPRDIDEIFSHTSCTAVTPARNDGGRTRQETTAQALKIANPLNVEFSYLRRSLIPNLLTVAKRNVSRGFKDIALYETGTVFIPRTTNKSPDNLAVRTTPDPAGRRPDPAVLEEIERSLPLQPTWIAAVFAGGRPVPIRTEFGANANENRPVTEGERYGWSDAIDCARFIADTLNVRLTVRQGKHQAFHPGRTADLVIDMEGEKRTVGIAGELHPRTVAELGLPERTAAMELSLDELIAVSPESITAAPISAYPVTTQDVALIVDEGLPAQDLQDLLEELAGDLLEEIKLFDDYRGSGVGDKKKSLAFTMSFRAHDRTLTADEASKARDRAVAGAEKKYGAQIRG